MTKALVTVTFNDPDSSVISNDIIYKLYRLVCIQGRQGYCKNVIANDFISNVVSNVIHISQYERNVIGLFLL